MAAITPPGLTATGRPLSRALMALLVGVLSMLSLQGCDDKKTDDKIVKVKIQDKEFKLELVADNESRTKGMGGRTEIKEDGGMLFAFPRAEKLQFVMRDCPIDIDVIFLDSAGRITAMHAMKMEAPRAKDEIEPDPRYGVNVKYEDRLKRYSSKYNAQFAIELKGGTLEKLKLKEGEKLKLDVAALKKKAK